MRNEPSEMRELSETEIDILKSYFGSLLFLFFFVTLLSSPGVYLVVSGVLNADTTLVIGGAVVFAGVFGLALSFLVYSLKASRDFREGMSAVMRGIVTGYRHSNKTYALYVDGVKYIVCKEVYESFGKGVMVEVHFGPRSRKVLAVKSETKEVTAK